MNALRKSYHGLKHTFDAVYGQKHPDKSPTEIRSRQVARICDVLDANMSYLQHPSMESSELSTCLIDKHESDRLEDDVENQAAQISDLERRLKGKRRKNRLLTE